MCFVNVFSLPGNDDQVLSRSKHQQTPLFVTLHQQINEQSVHRKEILSPLGDIGAACYRWPSFSHSPIASVWNIQLWKGFHRVAPKKEHYSPWISISLTDLEVVQDFTFFSRYIHSEQEQRKCYQNNQHPLTYWFIYKLVLGGWDSWFQNVVRLEV